MKGAFIMIDIKPIKWNDPGPFMTDYRNSTDAAMHFFEYKPYESLQKRYEYLLERTYPREELVSVMKKMHERWDAPDHTFERLQQLTDPKSTVVIGGQQAGLLTGPLYSLNKLISIIQYARKQERVLKAPVLPVFWIAGEDHDFEEINHVFIEEKNNLQKHRLQQLVNERATVSSISIDHELIGRWVDVVFTSLQETEHASDVYQLVWRCLRESETYVDFFARMLFTLLPNESFLLIDSGDPLTRHMQQENFAQLIDHQPAIAKSIYQTDVAFKKVGYHSIVDVQPHDGHLFYHLDGERILLERDDRNSWVGKQDEIAFTSDELLDVANHQPELLSNNVMTRPLMQEMMFPTLAFLGGNGEITYWALLKEAFRAVDLQMPPVIPRLSFTYVNKKTAHILDELHLDVGDVIRRGADQEKLYFLSKQTNPPIDVLMNEMKVQMKRTYEPIHAFARSIRTDIGKLAQSNEQIVLKEMAYLEKRMQQAVEEEMQHVLDQYAYIQMVLHPQNGLQERVWNPAPLLVEVGPDVFEQVIKETFDFKEAHYAIYI